MYQPMNVTNGCGYSLSLTGDGPVDHVRTNSATTNSANWALFDQVHFTAASAAPCGRCVQLTNAVLAKSTVVTIVGVCPAGLCDNPAADFALSRSAFSELGGDVTSGTFPPGITPTWQYVECPYPDTAALPIYAEIGVQNGTVNAVRFIDIRDGITTVEMTAGVPSGLSGALTRSPDNFWRLTNGAPFDPSGVTVRMTNVNGQAVTSSKLAATGPQLASTSVQFSSCVAP
jgi:hypothetical protein